MPKRRTSFEELMQSNAFATLESVPDLDLLVLRGHALIEAFLWELLARRIGVAESELPDLNFDRLARLATAGDRYVAIREQLLLLNTIRNGIAHQFDAAAHRSALETFVGKGATQLHVQFGDDDSLKTSLKYVTQPNRGWPDDMKEQRDQVRLSIMLLIAALNFVQMSSVPPKVVYE